MLNEKPLVSTQSVDFLDLQRSSWFTSPRGARDSCKVIFIATPPLWLILAGRPEVGAAPVQGRPYCFVGYRSQGQNFLHVIVDIADATTKLWWRKFTFKSYSGWLDLCTHAIGEITHRQTL